LRIARAAGFVFTLAIAPSTVADEPMNRAVFLDRDGTLMVDKDYLFRPEEVEVFPGAASALRRLQESGFKLIIVTNQSGVGRGYFRTQDVEKVHTHLVDQFRREGVTFTAIYYAPEAPDQPSHGRKPSAQFLFDARDQYGLSLPECYMIGDKVADLECGMNGGVKRSILVRTGYGAQTEKKGSAAVQAAVVVGCGCETRIREVCIGY
jgi:D-glycero-D-manno-heptose 1,7-bisphosphate phosphatase